MTIDTLISAEQIDERLTAMAAEINRDYAGKDILLVCTLTGGVIFLSDLARKLGGNIAFDFIRAASYGDGTISSGRVKIYDEPGLELEGKHVLVIEDIIDSGYTISYVRKYLEDKGAASVKVCALLDKPSRREVEGVTSDYLGFSIPDEFVVGYGLDYAQRYRNLPYVGIMRGV